MKTNEAKRSNCCDHITLCNVNKCRSAMIDRHGYGVIVNKESCVKKLNRSDINICWLGGLITISLVTFMTGCNGELTSRHYRHMSKALEATRHRC